jgi:hypothetical protein
VLGPVDPDPDEADLAVCPAARAAMLYVLDEDARGRLAPRAARDLHGIDGVDLVAHRRDGEAAVWSPRGELRFAPGGELEDRRGGRWSVEGDHGALGLRVEDGRVDSADYPDALDRLWSALSGHHAGDVLVSAAPGFEFVDWGGADHVGGGSHGSLAAGDSGGVMLACGLDVEERGAWSVEDVVPLVLRHFSLGS